MAGNKRVLKSRSKEAKLALEAPLQPKNLKEKARELKKTVHRLEVEIAATSRLERERRVRYRDVVPPPDKQGGFARTQQRLTYSQAREKRQKFLMQVMEFTITALLFVGACAGLYHWWLSRTVN